MSRNLRRTVADWCHVERRTLLALLALVDRTPDLHPLARAELEEALVDALLRRAERERGQPVRALH